MIKYKTWAISTSGEYPVVGKITKAKTGKQAGEEVFTPVYYPRDMLDAFTILLRVTTVDASRECKTLKQAVTAIEKNMQELITTCKDLKC